MTEGDARKLVRVSFVHQNRAIETRVCDSSKAKSVGAILYAIYSPLLDGKIVVVEDARAKKPAPRNNITSLASARAKKPVLTPNKRKSGTKVAHHFELIV